MNKYYTVKLQVQLPNNPGITELAPEYFLREWWHETLKLIPPSEVADVWEPFHYMWADLTQPLYEAEFRQWDWKDVESVLSDPDNRYESYAGDGLMSAYSLGYMPWPSNKMYTPWANSNVRSPEESGRDEAWHAALENVAALYDCYPENDENDPCQFYLARYFDA